MSDPATVLLEEIVAGLRAQKELAERALLQLDPHEWHARLSDHGNSVAVLVRHMAGNMRSRWRDFLHSDGEKADRDRDGEFELGDESPETLWRQWEEGWRTAFDAVEALTPADLTRTVTVRGRPQPAARALIRQLDHYGQHVGQILFLAKHLRRASWQPLSIQARRARDAASDGR
ncbi:MAG: DUF1572 family protein [Trueperaceae bacterium]|nr:DUF1572 family protein [Trueperaceae bacterium]